MKRFLRTAWRRSFRSKTVRLVGVLGVTLVMMAVVLTAFAQHRHALNHSKEMVLHHQLFLLRDAIDQYHGQNSGRYPASLEALVADGYLRKIPEDPLTNSAHWRIIHDDATAGVREVRSSATGKAADGSRYSDW